MRADAIRVSNEIKACMAASGFKVVRAEELQLRPVPAICVLGQKAAPVSDGSPK